MASTTEHQTRGREVAEETAEIESTDEQTAVDVEPDHVSDLPLDTVFELIKNERRRMVLKYIKTTEEDTVTIGDLAEYIAAYENGIDRVELNAQQRKRVYIGLYQCHLPKMDDANVIDFNKDRGRAELGQNADQLSPYLDIEDTEEDTVPTHRIIGGLALIAAVLILISRITGTVLLMDIATVGFIVSAGALPWSEPWLRERIGRRFTW